MNTKGKLLAAAFAVATMVGLAFAATTKHPELEATQIFVLPANAAPRTNVTPPRAGTLIWDSAGLVMCVSTGTTRTTWALVTSTSTACPH